MPVYPMDIAGEIRIGLIPARCILIFLRSCSPPDISQGDTLRPLTCRRGGGII